MHFSTVPATAALLALLPATIASPHSFARRDSSTGQCGAANGGLKCDGSTVNACCSPAGWCGDSTDHCGTGCQAAYGVCSLSLYLLHHWHLADRFFSFRHVVEQQPLHQLDQLLVSRELMLGVSVMARILVAVPWRERLP